ncbi:MAG: T9SS type A sorting domain-containing protein, partial [Phaeodactylibacter sp.]|nr:T9SS type A sorting domain-containing protein [Phaeodactylibacter sp.]
GTPFDPLISSAEEASAGAMRLYPNPALEEAVVEFPEPAAGILTIRSGLGQVVLTQQAAGQRSMRVDVRELPAGVYWVSFESGQGQWVAPLVKR